MPTSSSHTADLLESEATALLSHLAIGNFDCNSLMLHILDCLGTLQLRVKQDRSGLNPSLKSVFKNACNVMLDAMSDEQGIDEMSALSHLIASFPDSRKRFDGRGWLPLHWAAAVDVTESADLQVVIRDRPVVAKLSNEHLVEDAEAQVEASAKGVVGLATKASRRGLLPLHFVASLRHPRLDNVAQLVEVFPPAVRQSDRKGWLPIHWCSRSCSSVDVLQLLLDKWPNSVFEPTHKGQLPFQLALQNRNTEIMGALLSAHPDALDAVDNEGNNCLHDAVLHCNPYGAKKLLEWNQELATQRNFEQGQVPLHRLFQYLPASKRLLWHQLEVLKLLVEYNPETVTLVDKDGSLPLHLAVYYNSSTEVVELLAGTYPSALLIKDGFGKLPMNYTQDPGLTKILMGGNHSLEALGIKSNFLKFI